jgi:hypothetical protein
VIDDSGDEWDSDRGKLTDEEEPEVTKRPARPGQHEEQSEYWKTREANIARNKILLDKINDELMDEFGDEANGILPASASTSKPAAKKGKSAPAPPKPIKKPGFEKSLVQVRSADLWLHGNRC